MTIVSNLANLRAQIAAAAQTAEREARTVTLVAVSKFQPQEAVLEAYAAGQRVFGENRVQEAVEKFAPLRASHPDLRLQLIGALQTNKVVQAVQLFDVIATLDRPKLAERLAAEMAKQQRWPEVLIEVNIGDEPQKAGISPAALPDFIATCRKLALPIRGLMCIPPAEADPAPYFQHLAQLADQHNLPIRSMGMSNDFPTAIAHGSTEVRIGTALFGARG